MVHKLKVYFKEEQRFNQWWLKILLGVAFAVGVGQIYYGTIVQLTTGVPWGDEPVSDTELIITDVFITLIMVGVLWLVFGSKLITEVKGDGIYIRFKPNLLRKRFIPVDSIKSYEVKKYNPIKDYGGWGIRYGRFKKGMAYNVSGNIGLLLVLDNNKKFLIGTQRPDAIKYAMDKLMRNHE